MQYDGAVRGNRMQTTMNEYHECIDDNDKERRNEE